MARHLQTLVSERIARLSRVDRERVRLLQHLLKYTKSPAEHNYYILKLQKMLGLK